MARVLVVDDKEMMRDSVATTLARRSHTAVACPSAKAALERLREKAPDLIVTDLQMPDMNGLELLAEIRKIDEQLPVIVMTAFGTVETAVQAMKMGAYDYVTKPFTGDELALTVERAIEHGRLQRENLILRAAATPNGRPATIDMVGSSDAMRTLRAELKKIADSHGNVLINGESGTGKEVAARQIHAMSPRANAPFLALNCAALSANLLESELFGHEKGAFTGADKPRKGRFELADSGTLLLDEISEIAPAFQAKLLRVLQERSFERVGSSSSRSVDVRIIATSNRDLPNEVDKGRFRGDLFYRLNVLPVRRSAPTPAPRRRSGSRHATSSATSPPRGPPRPQVESCCPDAVMLLQDYSWPGNVRELQNICERAAVLASLGDDDRSRASSPWRYGMASTQSGAFSGGVHVQIGSGVSAASVMPHTAAHAAGHGGSHVGATTMAGVRVPRIACDGTVTLEALERESILATLERNHGHRVRSAKDLGIGVRTLGLKIKKWKEESLIPPEI